MRQIKEPQAIDFAFVQLQRRSILEVASGMAAQYPDDWLARTDASSVAVPVALLSLLTFNIFIAAAILLVAVCAYLLLPFAIWGRVPGLPRWAHQRALLSESAQRTIELLHQKLLDRQRAAVSDVAPSTGMEFWIYATKIMRAVGVRNVLKA